MAQIRMGGAGVKFRKYYARLFSIFFLICICFSLILLQILSWLMKTIFGKSTIYESLH